MAAAVNETPSNIQELLNSSSRPSALLSSPVAKAYLTQLTSLPLETLLTEPSRLSTESELLSADLTQLCLTQHPTFLSLHSASTALSTSLDSLTSSLDSMLTEWIPSLEQEAKNFTENTQSIQRDRRKAALVLDHQDKLADMLELPHLLATCVQNGYYTEALDLAAHFERNFLNVLPQTPLMESLHTSVLASIQALLYQLLTQLRSPAKLPVLFKTVNLLRRMDVLSEEQLAIAFLQGRTTYLEEAFTVASADTSKDRAYDPARHLRKWIEVFREGVYDIVNQYSSIFLTPSPLSLSMVTSTTPSKASSASLRSFLTTFTSSQISYLLVLLHAHMPDIPATNMASVSSLLTQLAYCASSFARIGLDFRPALQPIIEDAVFKIVQRAFREARAGLESAINDAEKSGKRLSEWLVVTVAINPSTLPPLPSSPKLGQLHIPPSHLTSYPPLAVFTNGILTALNSLRLLPPADLLPRVQSALVEELIVVSRDLLRVVQQSVSRNSEQRRSMDETEKVLDWRVGMHAGAVLWHEEAGLMGYLVDALRAGVYGEKRDASTGANTWGREAKEEWGVWIRTLDPTFEIDRKEKADDKE